MSTTMTKLFKDGKSYSIDTYIDYTSGSSETLSYRYDKETNILESSDGYYGTSNSYSYSLVNEQINEIDPSVKPRTIDRIGKIIRFRREVMR